MRLSTSFLATTPANTAPVTGVVPWAAAPPPDPALETATRLLAQGNIADALPMFEQLAAQAPEEASHRVRLAYCLSELGHFERAVDLYAGLEDEIEGRLQFQLHYAETLAYAGRRDRAVQILRGCLQTRPDSGEAWLKLANLKNEPFSAADIAAMRAQLEAPALAAPARSRFHYALGLAFEQAGDYAASFAHFADGAAAQRSTFTYNAGDVTNAMRRSKAFFTPSRFAALAGAGCDDAAPIFVVGVPRAGTTLVEQILASHSLVEGTRELREISAIGRSIGAGAGGQGRAAYPECLATLDAAAFAALGARYIERTRLYRHSSRPFFIDKMPSNWMHIGLIQLILPRAKIIDVRRQPMAGCFAVFKHHFGAGVEYSYDLTDTARYYNDYVDRMAHFDAALPGRVHRVMYERLVDDTEAEIRRLLAYCGLPFEPQCLRFWETRRAVATPSSQQVRRPVYRAGLEQWRNYEPWLGKLKEAVLL